MGERPEYIKCIADTHADNKGKTWCGRAVSGFTFADVDHAAMNGRAKGRLIVCPECRSAAVAALSDSA